MSAVIRINKSHARIDGYNWISADKGLERLLNSMLDPIGPSGADPNPDLHAAQAAIKELGGELIEFDEMEYVKGRIY